MKKLILLSIALHALLFVVFSPWAKMQMEKIDPRQQAQLTEEVKARELEREKQARLRREVQILDSKAAEVLKMGAEREKRPKLQRQIADLREKRDEVMERSVRELARFQERGAEEIRQHEEAKLEESRRRITGYLEGIGQLDLLGESGLDIASEDLARQLDSLEGKVAASMEQQEIHSGIYNELKEVVEEVSDAKTVVKNLERKADVEAMNDIGEARVVPSSVAEIPESVAALYEEARELEQQIATAKADIDAAWQAVAENTSYAEARGKAVDSIPSRPKLEPVLDAGLPATVGELAEFREGLKRAQIEMQDMNARADAALGRSRQRDLSAQSFSTAGALTAAARQTSSYGQVVDMTWWRKLRGENARSEMPVEEKTLELDEGKIIQAAMPGRRFTESSLRKGWLYLDTWYVIGPWENQATVDYLVKHPPEFGIDFDAKYYDGKFANRVGHPSEILKWEFYQSDQVRCQPPAVYAESTYYAYTDVWFEEEREMLVAVGSDDAARVWLNGQLIWEDSGRSEWRLVEGYRKVRFQKGFNELLVRIENGPKHCVWSIVLCPPEVLGE